MKKSRQRFHSRVDRPHTAGCRISQIRRPDKCRIVGLSDFDDNPTLVVPQKCRKPDNPTIRHPW